MCNEIVRNLVILRHDETLLKSCLLLEVSWPTLCNYRVFWVVSFPSCLSHGFTDVNNIICRGLSRSQIGRFLLLFLCKIFQIFPYFLRFPKISKKDSYWPWNVFGQPGTSTIPLRWKNFFNPFFSKNVLFYRFIYLFM